MKIEFPLSYSAMATYEECPRRWYQRYVVRAPSKPKHFFSLGHSLHAAVEYFYTGDSPPKLMDLWQALETAWISEGYRDLAQEAEYHDQGKQILMKFWEKHSTDYKKPIATELKFTVKLGGVPLTGKVDRVDAVKGGIGILDYKTGKPIDPERVAEDSQLTTYQAACELALKKKVRELTLYHLPTQTPLVSKRRTEEQVAAVVKRLRAVARGIDQDKFKETPTDNACRWCNYRLGCPAMKNETGSRF